MAGKPFTAEYQRQGLQVGRAPLPAPPAAPAVAAPPADPEAAAAMLASLERIERRLAEFDAIQVAPTAAASPAVEAAAEAELEDLRERIQQTHVEIAALRHPMAKHDRLVVAGEELAAIISATEHATGQVLGAAETIDRAVEALRKRIDDPELLARTEEILAAVVQIYEACNFQDITGQRITKVVHTLDFIEERVAGMIETWGADAFVNLPPPDDVPPDADKALLNGPQMANKAISQADIDALFG
jgi:chemotaxis protein CheZ